IDQCIEQCPNWGKSRRNRAENRSNLLGARRSRDLEDDKTEPGPPDRPKRAILGIGLAVIPPVWILSIGSCGAGRQRRNSGHGARLDIDLAAIVVSTRCGAARTDHDGIAGIGGRAAVNRLKALTPTDGKVALARLDDGGPGWRTDQHRAANAQCADET